MGKHQHKDTFTKYSSKNLLHKVSNQMEVVEPSNSNYYKTLGKNEIRVQHLMSDGFI